MLEIDMSFRGIKEVEAFVNRLPENIKLAGKDIIDATAKSISIGAKRRMKFHTMFSTGLMKSTTSIIPTGKASVSIMINAPYAAAQEYGFKGHWIPIEWMLQHQNAPGSRGERIDNPHFVWVSKPKNPEGYYVGPAVKSTLKRMPEIVDRVMKKRLK